MKKDMKEYWEIRSKSFPGYNVDDAYQISILDTIKKHGVVFAKKTVLDVGCGSGAYALRIASEAAHVTALDISRGMLEKLSNSAKENGITNIDCIESDWGDFSSDKKFDIIFCSLTPALETKEDVAKIMQYAQESVVYITSKQSVKTPLFDELFAIHGAKRKVTVFPAVVRNWLIENNVPFELCPIKGERESCQTHDEMVNNCIGVLEAADIKPDEAKIMQLAEKYKNSKGIYVSKTYFDTDMFIWQIS